ncbi:MAG: tetratricopeptide repeat protein [Porcipelethomonas sp.]
MGGIGKSELAKHYAITFKSEYDAVIFVRFQKNMMQTIISDINFPVVNCKRSEGEEDKEYLERKLNILLSICTTKHLIILDNFDVEDCDDLELLTGLMCDILVTSRVDYSDVFCQYEVENLQNENDIFSLVTYYYKEALDDENTCAVQDIINAAEGHTMAVELIAKHMHTMRISPSEMNQILIRNGITSGNEGEVKIIKDGSLKSKAAYVHIAALFSIFGLSEDIKQVLRYAALFGPNRVDKEFFVESCELTAEQKTAMESAITCGWIQELVFPDSTAVTLHPLISDVLCHELKPDIEHCGDFILFAAALSEDIQDFDCEQRYLHIAWLDHTARNICGNSTKITFLLDNMNMIYMTEEDYESAKWCNERIVEMIYALHEEENFPRQILNSYLFLKSLARFDGDPELEKEYSEKIKALGSAEAVEHIAFERCMDEMEAGDYTAAISSAEEQLKYAMMSEDGRRIAKAYRQIGEAERGSEHEDKANEAFGKAAEYIGRYLTDYPEETGYDLAGLYDDAGDIYTDAGRYEQALECYNKELELNVQEHGKISGYVKDTYLSMSLTYFRMGDIKRQTECLKKCLEISELVYGKVHRETLLCYECLYKQYITEWHESHDDVLFDECQKLLENLIEAQVTLNGEESEEAAQWYMEYSDFLRLKNDEDGCNSFMETAIRIYSNLLEEDDAMWIDLCCRASDSCLHFGKNEESLRYLENAITLCEINDETELLESLMKYKDDMSGV